MAQTFKEANDQIITEFKADVRTIAAQAEDAAKTWAVEYAGHTAHSQSIPPQVTVRKAGDPPREPNQHRSLIERAAECDDRDMAVSALFVALAFSDERLSSITVGDSNRWRRLSRSARLDELRKWVNAEFLEAMDLVKTLPISTIGD